MTDNRYAYASTASLREIYKVVESKRPIGWTTQIDKDDMRLFRNAPVQVYNPMQLPMGRNDPGFDEYIKSRLRTVTLTISVHVRPPLRTEEITVARMNNSKAEAQGLATIRPGTTAIDEEFFLQHPEYDWVLLPEMNNTKWSVSVIEEKFGFQAIYDKQIAKEYAGVYNSLLKALQLLSSHQ
jgi:hypothetical protein